ncbi:GAF sensor PilB/PulE/GspE family ATPase [Geotalea daltonii FRC-32]|uniref:GAF sensor PilB/PulE/GspE family ATPase n=1 Tax=Geotalea daltonii (strain DSM 22248 / JCM 15807 / FRC-32) TaxID=316067 RepID=B9M2L2_GEODF|nr:GspE/PulE family protein [Geotalea daltonii]ACM19391.1 GAF sensor PilB/PulE/GspE family ATPase [Geotalea daltonii FRC-32]
MDMATGLLKEQLEYRKRFMEKINEIHSAANLNSILIQLKDSIAELFKAERMTIYVADRQRNVLISRVKSGDELKQIVVPISPESIAGYCATSQQLINITNAYDDHELKMINTGLKFDDTWDKKTGFHTAQVLCVPMIFDSKLIGVMQLINKKGAAAFTSTDLSYASELATSLSIAIHNIYRISASVKIIRQNSRYNYLLDKNLIDEKDIQKASSHPDLAKIGLDHLIMREFSISSEDMAKSLSLYFGTDFVCFDGTLPPLVDLLERIKPDRLKKERWIPVKIENGVLQVAMEDPTDLAKQDLIRFVYPEYRRLSFVGAYRQDIDLFIDHFYNLGSMVGGDSSTISELLNRLDTSDEPEVEQEVQKVSDQDSVIVQLVNKIVCDAYNAKASDIHIEPYPGKNDVLVRIRIDGRCKIYQRIPYKYKHAITSRIKIMSGLDIAERRKPQDGKIDFKKFGPIDVELRVATLPTAGQLEDVVLRVLASGEPIPFDKLGLTSRNTRIFEESIKKPYGLILVVGPTGSGKTTTLHSAVARINDPETKIWTAEDPVEITQKGLRQVQVNSRIGFTFAAALRSFLRADPDVIMVGEMRDAETTSTGIEASLTGHLVFSTLHTNSAPETVTRLLDMGMDPFSFSDALLCILAQRLARRLCHDCREIYIPEQRELDGIIEEYGAEHFARLGMDRGEIKLARAKGCAKCNETGYKGRLGLHEILECTDAMKALIKRKEEVDTIRRQAIADGMTTLKQDGILKVFQGLTDLKEVRRVCIK